MMKPKLNMRAKHVLEGYFFISPWLIGFTTLFLIPLITSLIFSFSKFTELTEWKTQWAGIVNYTRAFALDVKFIPMFIIVIKDTLINTPFIVSFSLFIAILLNRDIKLRGFFRGLFFLPVLLGSGYVMQQLLGQNVNGQTIDLSRGIMAPEEIMTYLGANATNLVQEFLTRITLFLWKSGVQIVLFLAGLQGISKSLYESAYCDSASEWDMFWKITLPIISPVVLLNVVYTIIDSFSDSTNPVVDYIYQLAFKDFQFEYAAAISWIYFGFIFLLIILVFALIKPYSTMDEKEKNRR